MAISTDIWEDIYSYHAENIRQQIDAEILRDIRNMAIDTQDSDNPVKMSEQDGYLYRIGAE